MRAGLFWLNDRQWARMAPQLPTNLTGPEREDDRRIISGIIHMLQCGARWRDCPPEYGPHTTVYNRFNVSGALLPPCNGWLESQDANQLGRIGWHIWSTI